MPPSLTLTRHRSPSQRCLVSTAALRPLDSEAPQRRCDAKDVLLGSAGPRARRPDIFVPSIIVSPPPSDAPPPAPAARQPEPICRPLSSVRDRLFVADGEAASTLSTLQEAGVNHVLLCSGNLRPSFADQLAYRRLSGLYDDANACLSTYLPGALLWIKDVFEQGGRLLVCCRTGVSCSAAVACAYLMWSETLSFEAALASLRVACPQASPNEGFCAQLRNGAWRALLPPVARS